MPLASRVVFVRSAHVEPPKAKPAGSRADSRRVVVVLDVVGAFAAPVVFCSVSALSERYVNRGQAKYTTKK